SIKHDPLPSLDRTVIVQVSGWDLPGLTTFAQVISALTSNFPILGVALLGILFLWLLGMSRAAVTFAILGVVAGIVAFAGDELLGSYVGRSRPFSDVPETSFPSGHVFGSTVLFGFIGFLAVHVGLKAKARNALLGLALFMIVAVGFARVYEEAHWPSDVLAGYMLGGIGLLLLVPLVLYTQKLSWLSPSKRLDNLLVESCETCRVEHSIASTVVLNPLEGTATKTYQPPPVVRLIYWLSFQARFPYESNPHALRAAVHRRQIASLLTKHRFGKDLVAHVTSESCNHGSCTFVTEFIPGDKVENDDDVKLFLGQVAEIFTDAGLGVWQINPRNPHAHTNVIRNKDGDYIIIDLESAVATPFPAAGQWRSSFKAGSLPLFDDIDFVRLRRYVDEQKPGLKISLGEQGLADLREAVDAGEESLLAWQRSEPRVWGRIIRSVYRLLNWKSAVQHLLSALDGADRASQRLLDRGIARWESQNGLSASEAAGLRAKLSAKEAQGAVHHLGAHLVLSLAIAVPVPGIRSLARFLWTLAFMVKAQVSRLLRRRGAAQAASIHTPLVAVITLLPIVGGIAYLAARPLRSKLLIRIALDEVAVEMPFGLYRRLRLARWLAPKPISAADVSAGAAPVR
ncbi:MAG: phosphatase PAP2 family protein, partial [Dehalococcoidia bacterium]